MSNLNDDFIDRLDILIALLTPAFDESKYSSGVDVLRYCDAEHTVDDMMKKVKKSRNAIEKALVKLRADGIVRSVKKQGKTFYVRLK